MKYTMSDISFEQIEFIKRSYQSGNSLINIAQEQDLTVSSILSLFQRMNWDIKREDCSSFNITGEKLLVLADTHLGSLKENPEYIDLAINEGIKEGVCAGIMLGDIIQGNMCFGDKDINTQLDEAYKYIGSVNNFPIYGIGGNHDMAAAREYDYVITELAKIVKYMGYKQCYFNWNDYMFAMYHAIKHFNDPLLLQRYAMMFMGHGHNPQILSSSRIKVPTQSDDIIHPETGAKPGFMIVEMYDGIVYIDLYGYEEGRARVRKENYFVKELNDFHKVA